MSNKDFSVPRNKSLAPGRTPFRPTDIIGRQLGSGPLNRRATSVGPSAANPSTKNDPRPVKNPEYIRSCAVRVEDFVRTINPGAVLSPKAFASPTVKDFEVIWETLFHAFDGRWCKKSKGKKIEETVPYVLKSLGYPIAVSKSALSAPGSTHSWPQIILALDWFVTIIEMNNSFDINQTDAGQDLMQIEEDGMVDSAKTFDWLCESYGKYMNFDDEGCGTVDNAFISQIQEDHEQQKEYNEKLRYEVERVSADVTSLQQKPSPLLEVKREIEAMEQDGVSFETEIKQLEEVISRLQKKAGEYEISINMKKQETQAIVKQIEEIKEQVAGQKVTKEDINRLMNEKQKLEQMLQNAITHKNSVEQEVNNKEVQLDSLLNGLEKIIHEYNNKVSETMPMEDRQSLDVDLFITLNRNATTAEEKRITNALLSLKQKYTEQNKTLVEEGQRLESLYSQQLNKTVETQQQHVELVSELERLRQESMRNKEALASFKQNGEDQLRLREDEIQRIKQHIVEMVQAVQQRVPDAEAAYRKLEDECEEEKKQLLVEQRKKVEIYKRVHHEVSIVSENMRKLNEMALKEAQDLIPKDKE